jgi:hypothetical protein
VAHGTSADAAAVARAVRLRLATWPASSVATLAGEGSAPAYAAAPAASPSEPDGTVRGAGLDDLLDGLHGDALVAVADRVVSRLRAEPLTDGEAALGASVQALHRLGRRVSAEWHRRIAELDERDAWQALRCRSTSDWLTSTLALTPYEARTAVDVARVLEELPETAARFAAGEIDVAAVQAAATAHAELARLEAKAEAEREAAAQGRATGDSDDGATGDDTGGGDDGERIGGSDEGRDDAGGGDPDTDGRDGSTSSDGDDGFDWARGELDRLIAEGTGGLNRAEARARVAGWQHKVDERYGVEREQRAWRNRKGRLHMDEIDGVGHARFELDAVGFATLRSALEPLARKRRADDERSWSQRMADALVAICQHALDDSEWLPETAGGRPQVIVVSTAETFEGADPATPAHLDGVGDICSETARLLACDGAVTEVVVDAAGRPLQVRETGRVTLAQRLALIIRDQGCVGCGAPVSQTQVHHIVFRRNHGATVVENLVLVCWSCHRKLHHHGWRVLVDGGRYRVVPPWHPEADRGIRQPHHCGRSPR